MTASRLSLLLACCLVLATSGATAASLCFEAEHANELSMPFQIVEMKDTSGGLAVSVPEGGGDFSAFGRKNGSVTYRVPIPEDGQYRLWLRVRWNGHCSNSVIVQVGRLSRKITTKKFGRWHWRFAWPCPLKKGVVTIRLRSREDGVWIDQLLLTTEQTTPKNEIRKTTLIPGVPSKESPELQVWLPMASGGLPVLPPTDFRLRHRGGPRVRLDRLGCSVLRPNHVTPLTVWLRNNSLAEAKGKVTLDTAAPMHIRPGRERTVTLAKGAPLQKVTFDLIPKDTLARREHALFVRVQHPTGKITGHKVRLLKPFQWLVTNALPCPVKTGLATPTPLDANVKRGFPGSAEGLTWSVANEFAVTPFGLLNMRRAVTDKTYVMAYAYTAVNSETDTDALLDVRHDDMIRVWLNGEPVFSATRCIPSVISRQQVRVKLKKGRNDVLVKICQVKNYWEFGVGFLTLDKKPAAVAGLDVAPLVAGKK